jgi:hypothetical protein
MDDVRPGMDEAKMMESFTEFAAAKAWPVEQRDAAMMVYAGSTTATSTNT